MIRHFLVIKRDLFAAIKIKLLQVLTSVRLSVFY